MKNFVLLSIYFLLLIINYTSFSYSVNEQINSFVNSPSLSDIDKISDKKLRVCQQVFLEAFMRREFTDNENLLCSDIFERNIEAIIEYEKKCDWERGIN